MNAFVRASPSYLIIFFLICLIIGSPFAFSAEYEDELMVKWNKLGIIFGDGTGFSPEKTLTTAQGAAIINRIVKYTEMSDKKFGDVREGDWFYEDLMKLNKVGAILGDGNNLFPNQPLNRERAIVILARIFEQDFSKDYLLPEGTRVSPWAIREISHMYSKGYLNMYSTLSLNSLMTRGEFINIIDNMISDISYLSEIDGNTGGICVNNENTSFENAFIDGNLYISTTCFSASITNTNINGNIVIFDHGQNSEVKLLLENVDLTGSIISNEQINITSNSTINKIISDKSLFLNNDGIINQIISRDFSLINNKKVIKSISAKGGLNVTSDAYGQVDFVTVYSGNYSITPAPQTIIDVPAQKFISDNPYTGYFTPDENTFFVENNVLVSGLKWIDGELLYFNDEGIMSYGFKNIDRNTYYFDDYGIAVDGFYPINGQWYYFYPDTRIMAVNTLIDGFFINEFGVATKVRNDIVYGRSGYGRELIATRLQAGSRMKTVLFNFTIHGFEDEFPHDGYVLKNAAEAMIEYYEENPDKLKNSCVYIVPMSNPDGLIDGWTNNGPGRNQLSLGIDLNRDFDYFFKTNTNIRNKTLGNPFSAPESKALKDLFEEIDPDIVIDFHGWDDRTIGNPRLASVFYKHLGLVRTAGFSSATAGFFSAWASSQGAESLLVEYTNSRSVNIEKTLNAVNELL